MTISETIFDLISQKGMTQKDFAKQTGIAESSISDWKRKKTNPASEKLLIIAKVLDVSVEDLLSGTASISKRSKSSEYVVYEKDSEIGKLIEIYQGLNKDARNRLIGYMSALSE